MSDVDPHANHGNQRCDSCRPIGTRVSETLREILAEIPERLAIDALLRDAHDRLRAALESETSPEERAQPAVAQLVAINLATVLHEAATHLVEIYTNRTGEPFHWIDAPEPPEDDVGAAMHFALDANGHLTLADPPPAAPTEST